MERLWGSEKSGTAPRSLQRLSTRIQSIFSTADRDRGGCGVLVCYQHPPRRTDPHRFRVEHPEILNQVYQSYGQNHLQKSIRVDSNGVSGLLKGLGKEALQFTPANFVDTTVYEELEREGLLKRSTVE